MSHLPHIITVFPPHNMPLLLIGIPLFGSLGYFGVLHTIKPWTRHSRGAKVWHLPHNYLPWRLKLGHTMEIQAGSHNGDSKPVHTMEIQAGSHNEDRKLVHTMEIQSRFTQLRSKPVHTMEIQAGSHNGDPKPVHTMGIQDSSHNGDPN